jgi:hypothetical protein
MPRKRKLKPASKRQQRWREKKYAAEIAAGVRKPKQKPRTSTQRWRKWRDSRKAEEETAKYAASRERRAKSRAAPPIPPEFRIGDCREELNIAANSTTLVLTDPPWDNKAEWCYRWLGDFAARVLMPGGSLICFIGGLTSWREVANLLGERLQDQPLLHMPLTQVRPLPGLFVRPEIRDVLWFSKGRRRNQLIVPTLARSSGKDKSLHPWQQGDAVWQWIEALTDPGDLVIDPFAGSGEWGHICAAMGRRWIGCDIKEGGSTTIAA